MRRKSGRETQSRFDGFLVAKMRMRHDMEGKNASQAQAHSCGPIQPVKPTKIQIHAPQWSCHPKTDARSWPFQKGNRVPQDSPNPLRLGVCSLIRYFMQFKCPCWPPDSSELNAEIQAAVSQLVDSGEWARYKSPHQELVRKSLAELSGCEHVRLCGSGSAAVEIALRAAGVGPGDEVIVAAYDYGGNFRAIEAVGAKPVLVDVAPNSVTINAEQVAQFANGPDAGLSLIHI